MDSSPAAIDAFLEEVHFDDRGLVVAIAQDSEDDTVLMTAFMSERAIRETLRTGVVHYYSRSRDELWKKGATSGHEQRLRAVRIDCDGDALLLTVDAGPACHTGYRRCFYRRWHDSEFVVTDERAFDPDVVYD